MIDRMQLYKYKYNTKNAIIINYIYLSKFLIMAYVHHDLLQQPLQTYKI